MFYFCPAEPPFINVFCYVLLDVFCQALPNVFANVFLKGVLLGVLRAAESPKHFCLGLLRLAVRTRAHTQSRRTLGRTGFRSRDTSPIGLMRLGGLGSRTSGTSPKTTLWRVAVSCYRSRCRTRQTVLVSSWLCRRCVGLRHLPMFRHRLQKSCSFISPPVRELRQSWLGVLPSRCAGQ